MRRYLVPSFLALLSAAFVSFGYFGLSSKTPVFCTGEYALCTSAKCIPDPDDAKKTICFCEIKHGKSLGKTSCRHRIASYVEKDNRHVISTFSFEEFKKKSVMTCEEGMWSDCLDQPCTVDPMNPKKAICRCKLVKRGPYQTLGGSCEKRTCTKGFWSGATIETNQENVKSLMKELKIQQNPGKHCD